MEDKANQALEQLLERAISGVDSAVEFSQAQIPDVVEQLLMWHMVESIMWCIPSILFMFLSFLFLRIMFKKDGFGRSSSGDVEEGALGFSGVVFGSLFGLSLMMLSTDWLQILIAPKLYLLEYAAQLVK